MDSLRKYDYGKLVELINSIGEKTFRAKQLYEWVHVKRVSGFDEMSNLPAGLREKLAGEYLLDSLTVLKKQQATAPPRSICLSCRTVKR